jgi:hypothetical protein
LRPTTRIIIFQLNTCGYSPNVTSSLTRVLGCRLQLLLVLASAVILRSESRGTHDHILLSQFRDSPNLVGQVPVFISPRDLVARLSPRHWVPFSSPPTTRRATVEVLDPVSHGITILASVVLFITPFHGPGRKRRFQQYLLLHACPLPWERVYRACL